ncbi:MAG: efflux RND transporter periplasmic adaptor subunit [Deltaproteobacteria bacterium]|nr:efflux RND transporter periplasmic adaptor subunit [Deltaproteobacteria bacterium]
MKRKKSIIAATIMVIAVIGWWIYSKIPVATRESVGKSVMSVAVEVTPIKKSLIREVGVFTGTLLPESQFIVAPKIAGKLNKLFVNIGVHVKQGQLIALLEDEELVQQVDQARAELAVARANLEESRSALNLAQREFERAQALRKKKIVSESELDAAEAQYRAGMAKQKVAIAQVAQKEAELKTSQVRLDYTRMKASWADGGNPRIVGERFVDEGAMLAANTPVVSIIDIHTLTAVIHVIEREYPRIMMGQDAVITTDAYPDRAFRGTIARIAPLLKEAARQARVEVAIPNPERLLKPGMFVRVEIEFNRRANATVVPVNALTKHDGRQGIFLADMETMRAKLIPVTVGIVSNDMAEIVEPPVSGMVVTVGQHLLEDGAVITVPEKRKDETSNR